jgi:hypothetical protein
MNRAPLAGDDQIRWQGQAATLLGKLLELAAPTRPRSASTS